MATTDPLTMTWQGFVLVNLVGLLCLVFWLGKQKERLDNLKQQRETDKEEMRAELAAVEKRFLETGPHIIPLAELAVELKNLPRRSIACIPAWKISGIRYSRRR